MLPINSGNDFPCTPVSSNCVIWQGPDIACINLCNGDTVSDVIAKLATELCNLIDQTCTCNPDLSTLTLDCIPAPTAASPTFLDYMQNIVNYICALPTNAASLPDITVPPCLPLAPDPITGEPVRSLPLDQFALFLGNQICILLDTVVILQNTLNDHAARLLILENCVLPCQTTTGFAPFDVVSQALFPGSSVELSTLVLAIETELNKYTNAIGSLSMIGSAISSQAVFGTSERLSASGTYAADANWINSPTTLAQSNQDQWVVINDLYSAVKDLQSAVDVGCDAATFAYTYNVILNGSGVATDVNLNFTGSSIPVGYTDCGGGSLVKITDSNGNVITQNVNISNLQNDPLGTSISIVSLNVLNSITIEIDFCVSDGSSQCREKQTQTIPLSVPCPTGLSISAITQTSCQVNFSNLLGTNVEYKIDIEDLSSRTIAATATILTPPSTIAQNFTGLSAGTNYKVTVTVISNGVPKICPSISFATLGIECNDILITSTGAAGSNDIYLGYYKDTPTTQVDYHYNPDTQQIVIGASGAVACNAPTVSWNETTGAGILDLDLSFGATPGVSITIESSADGLTFSNPDTGADGNRLYASGITTGTIYVRIFVNCASTTSEYLLARYDFATDNFLIISSPEECTFDESITDSCPMGIEVAQQFLGCGATTYTVFAGGADSYWYYIGKYNRGGATVYLYAGWTQASAPTTVVECCACPAFILTDSYLQERTYVLEGRSVDIELPYILGEGVPQVSVVSPTTNGTLVQNSTYPNQFTYTHVNTGNSYADTFQVKLETVTAGDCAESTVTVQIQVIPCSIKLEHRNQNLFVFLDTNSFTIAEGTDIKDGLTAITGQWAINFSWTGNFYFIPVNDKRWLGYQKAIVDDGVSANLDPAAGWVALRNLPSTWAGGSGVPIYKEAALVLAFTNDASGDYHDGTLAAGFGSGVTAQPRADYLDDYDAYHDSLNGTLTSDWAKLLPIRGAQFPDGLSFVHYPFTGQNSVSADAAQVLQSLAAYTGEMIPANEYGVFTAVDVTGFLLQGLIPSATNPYQGAVTPGGNTLQPLYQKNALVLVDNKIKTNTFEQIGDDDNSLFQTHMEKIVRQCSTGGYPTTNAGTVHYSALSCATGASLVINRTGLPAVNPYYAINSTYRSLAGDNSTGAILDFTVIGYTTASATVDVGGASLAAGCEIAGSIFTVEDCTSGDQYIVEMGAITGIDVGEVYKLTNTGANFTPGPPRADWNNGEIRCVFIVSTNAGPAEITSVTSAAVYASCVSCTP